MTIDFKRKDYCYKDCLKFPTEGRWELIEGVPYAMTPSPCIQHQDISMYLSEVFCTFFKGKKCRPYAAPLDVLFPEEGENASEVRT